MGSVTSTLNQTGNNLVETDPSPDPDSCYFRREHHRSARENVGSTRASLSKVLNIPRCGRVARSLKTVSVTEVGNGGKCG